VPESRLPRLRTHRLISQPMSPAGAGRL